jgi:hypothetical protein
VRMLSHSIRRMIITAVIPIRKPSPTTMTASWMGRRTRDDFSNDRGRFRILDLHSLNTPILPAPTISIFRVCNLFS